ncbi:MAG: murein hydrolase activator EnvC family protein [Caulobacterales bacterium]
MPSPARLIALLAGVVALAAGASAGSQTLEDRRRTLEALNAQESALAAELGEDRNRLARVLGALQRFTRDPPPALLVSPRQAKDAVRAMILARAIAPELEARERTLEGEAEALAVVRRRAAQASGELFTQESALADRRDRLEALAQDAADLAPPSVRAAAQAHDAQPPPAWLMRPAAGTIAARFGGRLASGPRSHGLAWRTAPGAAVVAPTVSVVEYAGPLAGWGQVVILRAGGGCHMVLSGLEKVLVSSGQSVGAGQPIGVMPGGEHASPELYLEVRLGAGPIDPTALIRAGGIARRSP